MKSVFFAVFFSFFLEIQAQNNLVDTSDINQLIDEVINYAVLGNNLVAIEEILDLSESINYARGISFGLEEKATYYKYLGHYEKAILVNQKLYKFGQSIQDKAVILNANLGMADVFTSLKMKPEVLSYYEKAQKINEDLKDPLNDFLIQNGIGGMYLELGDFSNALDYFSKAKSIAEDNDLVENNLVVDANLGLTYAELGQAELAIPLCKEILRFEQSEGDSLEFAISYANLAFCYQKKRDFEKAFMYYDSSLIYARKFDLEDVRFSTYFDLSEAYEAKDEYQNALNYHQRYQLLKDTTLSNRTRRQTNELEKLFQKEKREKEILLKQQEVEQLQSAKKSQWFFIVILSALLIIASLLYLRKRDKSKRTLKVQQMQQALIESQLKNKELQAQQLSSELANKHADLTNLALDIARKNKFSNELMGQLDELQKAKTDTLKQKLREINLYVTNDLRISEDLALLQTNVDYINQAFYQKIDARFTGLSANDKYVLGLIRLNLSNKDIAVIKGISAGSAKVMRYRLRKKMGLTPDTDFASFLQEF